MNGKLLPPVQTNKEYMDYLESMIGQTRTNGRSKKGRPHDFKTYIIESDEDFPQNFTCGNILIEIHNTGLDHVKILSALYKEKKLQFFLDVSDKRFYTLHTNEDSIDVRNIIDVLTNDHSHTFDNTWFYSSMLKKFSTKEGNKFNGLKISHNSEKFSFMPNKNESDLQVTVGGSDAVIFQDLIKDNKELSRKAAYQTIRILRGSSQESIQDDVHSNGYFAIKHGKSIQNHLYLVNSCKEEYSNLINTIEYNSIGRKNIDGKVLFDGDSFDFEFNHEIEDLELFINKMFNSTKPFRLWGLKTKIADDYYKVTAVDLHMGSPINFDISKNTMRVYLYKGNCGNTILRLFTNLQIYFDSNLKCKQFGD